MREVKIEPGWRELLQDEFASPYMEELRNFLLKERTNGGYYPPTKDIFNAFNLTPLDQVRVVILGQDPYHTPGAAMGLAFSVPDGVKHPPSLRNIFKERETDLGLPYPESGNLTPWAERGVLLLNTTLTVRPHQARSHFGHGWERLTGAAVQRLSEKRDGLVFILWGRDAQDRGATISPVRHLVIESPHPSPLSARTGFFGSRPFSRTNDYLQSRGETALDWSL